MSFEGRERRRSPRLRIRIPVVLRVESVEDVCETVEIGLGGIFVATYESYRLRQLVELRLEMDEGGAIDVRGMVVRVVDEETAFRLDTEPGVGIQLYGVPEEEEYAWRTFFEECLEEAGYFDDADGATIREDIDTFDGRPPLDSLPEPIECLDDAHVMLQRGYTVEQVARAAGLDPSILAAALASDEAVITTSVGPDIGQTVEGVSLLSSRPPYAFQDDVPTLPVDRAPRTAPEVPGARAPEGAITSVIKIIGPSPSERSRQEPAGGPSQVEEDAGEGDEEGPETVPRIRLVALGPIQPPSKAEALRERRRPRLVPIASAPLAPTGILPHVVYRLELPSVPALEEFRRSALEPGGVFILTIELRPAGTPVVVCIVHPDNGDEFHIPGTVTHSLGGQRGVNVRFDGMTRRTIESFSTFITVGRRTGARDPDQPYSSQEITLVSRASEVLLRGRSGKSIPRDTQPVKMSEIEPLKKS